MKSADSHCYDLQLRRVQYEISQLLDFDIDNTLALALLQLRRVINQELEEV